MGRTEGWNFDKGAIYTITDNNNDVLNTTFFENSVAQFGVDLTKETKVLEHINRIPGIELSDKAYRKFVAEIKGNINGDNYVTSFKWIN